MWSIRRLYNFSLLTVVERCSRHLRHQLWASELDDFWASIVLIENMEKNTRFN